MKTTRRRGTPDFILLVLTFLLVGFGILMIFSASSATAAYKYQDPLFFTKRQIIWAVLGLIAMLFLMNIPYARLRPLIFIAFAGIVMMLILVLFNDPIKGARRGIGIGDSGIGFQPSEFAKLGIILYLSHLIAKKGDRIRDFQRGLLPLLIITCSLAGLIMLQPDFGTAAIFLSCAAAVMIAGGVNMKHFIAISAVGAAGVTIFVGAYLLFSDKFDYIEYRFFSFLDPWKYSYGTGWQLIQSLFALGHGKVTGTGIGQSIQKLHYLPEAHNDFIFSVIGEELGFVGSTIFLAVFVLFLWRCMLVGLRCKDKFGLLVAVGIVTMFGLQTLINIGGVTGTIPITGIPIPFVSYGGSSLLVSMVCVGILLSVSRENNRLDDTKT